MDPPSTPRCARYVPRPVRPHSAPRRSYFGETKTERWREAGAIRWPAVSTGPDLYQGPDIVPMRRYCNNMQDWSGELWARSLRKPGVFLQHPTFADCNISAKELHEQWGDVLPVSARLWPYSGATSSGPSTLPSHVDMKDWVERPVAAGKYSLKHMHGHRYQWDATPRHCLIGLQKPVR
ncbi:unnamed protein product [Effrenium voratum]|uniref:Uncharacterized protein n=1 Tax=Effrenium voratum TaxID=2562239 RepID=A0AA36JEQ8_9DINO|nr:unnamed protein product [Effrenium voratum]CAJ1446421.1 unnamed protein product [Effrenium voratum]